MTICKSYIQLSSFLIGNLFFLRGSVLWRNRNTGLPQFSLLDWAEQMFLVVIPRKILLLDAGISVHSFVLFNEMNCFLHNIKHLSSLGDNSVAEMILEKSIYTIHV